MFTNADRFSFFTTVSKQNANRKEDMHYAVLIHIEYWRKNMIKVEIFDDGRIIAYNNIIADSVLFEKISFTFRKIGTDIKKPLYSGMAKPL